MTIEHEVYLLLQTLNFHVLFSLDPEHTQSFEALNREKGGVTFTYMELIVQRS